MKVVPAVEGAAGVDLGKLLATTGMVTLDPGFVEHRLLLLGDHLHRR